MSCTCRVGPADFLADLETKGHPNLDTASQTAQSGGFTLCSEEGHVGELRSTRREESSCFMCMA